MAESNSYGAIFGERGASYHQAMEAFPDARSEELRLLVELAQVEPGQIVCDVPSGGGYLRSHLPAGVEVLAIDPAAEFSTLRWPDPLTRRIQAELHATGLADACADAVLSLAGLHHVADKRPFYREAARLLRPGARLVVADVHALSKTARFLDDVVGRYTSLGHEGAYFDDASSAQITDAGLVVESAVRRPLHWNFDSRGDMAAFCRQLFALENVDDATLLSHIERVLGIHANAMRWELLYVVARRDPTGHTS